MSTIRPVIGITTSRYAREGKPPIVGIPMTYVQAVERAGGIPVLLPFHVGPTTWQAYEDLVDGLVFPGGGDVSPEFTKNGQEPLRGLLPERDAMEVDLIRRAIVKRIPFLAICRGIQVLNVALGGTLYTHLPRDYPGPINHDGPPEEREKPVHAVHLDPDSRLARWLQKVELKVNTLHHQGLKSIGQGLRVVGRAEDGLPEAVEVEGHPFGVGVQWHPELLAPHDEAMARLFQRLIEEAIRYHEARTKHAPGRERVAGGG